MEATSVTGGKTVAETAGIAANMSMSEQKAYRPSETSGANNSGTNMLHSGMQQSNGMGQPYGVPNFTTNPSANPQPQGNIPTGDIKRLFDRILEEGTTPQGTSRTMQAPRKTRKNSCNLFFIGKIR